MSTNTSYRAGLQRAIVVLRESEGDIDFAISRLESEVFATDDSISILYTKLTSIIAEYCHVNAKFPSITMNFPAGSVILSPRKQ